MGDWSQPCTRSGSVRQSRRRGRGGRQKSPFVLIGKTLQFPGLSCSSTPRAAAAAGPERFSISSSASIQVFNQRGKGASHASSAPTTPPPPPPSLRATTAQTRNRCTHTCASSTSLLLPFSVTMKTPKVSQRAREKKKKKVQGQYFEKKKKSSSPPSTDGDAVNGLTESDAKKFREDAAFTERCSLINAVDLAARTVRVQKRLCVHSAVSSSSSQLYVTHVPSNHLAALSLATHTHTHTPELHTPKNCCTHTRVCTYGT